MSKGDRLPDGSHILELDEGYALVTNRGHFITGRLEEDRLNNQKAFADRKAALADLRQRVRVSRVIGWQLKGNRK